MENPESRIALSPEAASDDFASPIDLNPAETRAYWRGVVDGLRRAGARVPPDVAERAEAAEMPPPWDSAPPANPAEAPAPWESAPPAEAGRQRHDAFTGARKQAYLKALAKAGCILDACRLTGISSSTVYNHQASDPDFERHCRLALDMASAPIELTAYERAVVGIEEDVIRGGKVVGTRMRRSDYMLRVLLQGSNPKKYGPRPGFTRKRLLRFERKRIEREIEARKAAEAHGPGGRKDARKLLGELSVRLAEIKQQEGEQRRAEGWTELGWGIAVPPGWVWAGEGDPAEALAELEKNRDAVCNSSSSSTSPLYPSPGSPGEGERPPRDGG